MDSFSRYNKIKMYPDDEKHTLFRTQQGVYCYTVIPSSLQNVGDLYQKAMTTSFCFCDHFQKIVECYVDDITVKSRNKDDRIQDFQTIFNLMRTHQLKLNHTKSFLGVGNFFGFVVTSKGIHLYQDKVNAIQNMQPQEI